MEIAQGKKYFKADAGMFLGTVIDVVDMPNVQTQYGVKNKVRIQWVLATLQGAPVLDPEGKPMTVAGIYNATSNAKGELTKRLQQILNTLTIPLLTQTEQLAQLLIGRSNVLVLVKSANPKDANDPYTNVDSIAPLAQGMVPPPIPAGFVRQINRPKVQAGPYGQPVNTYAQPQQQQYVPPAQPNYSTTAAPVDLNAPSTVNKPF